MPRLHDCSRRFLGIPAFLATLIICVPPAAPILRAQDSVGEEATFYFYGLVRKSSYSEQTVLLTGESVLDSEIPTVAVKLVSRRLRPNAVSASSDFSDTFFKSPAALINKGGSFPSGHAAAIFSVATVIAEWHRQHRWVPWVAYGMAASISFSRVPTFAHSPSDVFLGAALGYTITRFDILRDRTH